MLLSTKRISPSDRRRYTIDYNDWLDDSETLSSVVFAVSTGPATVPSSTISTDGKSVNFFVTGASLSFTPFNVTVAATTSVNQVKNDHVAFNVAAS